MSTLAPGESNAAELSDDDSSRLDGAGEQLDNSRVSALYLSRHGDGLHEALDINVNPTTYSEHRREMEVIRTSPLIMDALRWYREDNKDVPFNVFDCSWDDLFEQIARAQGDHEVDRKKNRFKYLWKKAGSKADAIRPWLQVIPDDHGMSVVRGAIGVVFHMAEKAHEKEKAILEGFETITETIHIAMSEGVSFQHEPEMKACCQALYDSLADGIADLIWSLKSEDNGNLFERMKHKHEKKRRVNIEGMLKKVQKQSDELARCAERIKTKKALETHHGVGHLKKEASVARALLVDVKTDQGNLLEVAQMTSSNVQMLDRNVQYMGAAASHLVQATVTEVRQIAEANKELQKKLLFMDQDRMQILSAKNSQNAMIQLLVEAVYNVNAAQEEIMKKQNNMMRDFHRSLSPVPFQDQLVLDPSFFLALLNVPLKLVNDDLYTALTHSGDFSHASQQRAQSLLAGERFGAWMWSPRSELLFVDGNDPLATHGQLSPMSLVCATLSSVFERWRQNGSAIILHFFCGLHEAEDDNVRGPVGMMRTLLVQLAAAVLSIDLEARLDFGCIPEEEFCQDLRSGEPSALFHAFARLLRLVPPQMTVFILVDGVSAFEDRRFEEDLADVVASLERWVAADRRTLKVLLTCPYRSIFLVPKEHIPESQYVVVDACGRGGYGILSEESVAGLIYEPQ